MILSKTEIKSLMEHNDDQCVSIYMPTHTAGPETRQDPIRFKNVLSLAEEKLREVGWQDTDAQAFLEQAYQLDRDGFWQHQNEGLALFISSKEFHYYRLPLNFEEEVVLSHHFYLKPLMPLLVNNGRFYVLALSQNQVQLFQASQYQISEVPLKDMPLSLEEALKYDDPEEQLQMHTGNPSPAQGQSLVYHGQGVGTTDNKDQIRRFLQKLDRGLHDILVDEQAPLVLAGVEFIMAMYREVTHYPNVLEEGITGNPENTSPKELHEQAWKIVHPCFQASQSKAETEYKELMGNQPEKVSHDLEEVIKAAHNQRIDSLFVTLDEQIWGKFNSQTQEITLQRENQSGNEDLLDFAVIHTYLNGGAVYTGDPETLPERTLISAILRY